MLALELWAGLAQDAHRCALRPAVLLEEHAKEERKSLVRREPHLHASPRRCAGVKGVRGPPEASGIVAPSARSVSSRRLMRMRRSAAGSAPACCRVAAIASST